MSDINQNTWRSQLEDEENFIILDVRTSEEFKEQRLPNSINIDFYNPQNFMQELEKLELAGHTELFTENGKAEN